jgi:hypothetical protein
VVPTLRVIGGAKAQITASSVVGIIGSYQGCTNESGSWVLDTTGNAGVMETLTGDAAPSVELNDVNCTLQIDSINTSTTGYTSAGLNFTGTGAAAANTYQTAAVGFDAPADAGGALSFYANAQATVTNASAAFALTVIVGDDPNIGSSNTTATTAVVTGSVSSVNDVPAPDYATDLSSVTLQQDVNGLAVTVSGTVNLDFVSQAGENYETFQGQDLSTSSFATIDGLWNGNIGSETAITGTGTVSIPTTAFVSIGDQLSETSTVVVQHMDSASQVPTYEVSAITFFGGS